jgi:TRAP-type C4-dicarboxylate transport system permease small subunit
VKSLSGLDQFERLSLSLLVICLSLVVFIGTLARYTPWLSDFSMSAEEIGRLFLVWLWAWGGAIMQRSDEHYRMTILTDHLRPRHRLMIDAVADVIVLGVFIELFRQFTRLFRSSLGLTTMALEWPQVIFTSASVLGVGLMLIYTAARLIRRFRGNWGTP